MENIIIRMIQISDFEDIHELNTQLGYDYDKKKVYKKIISLLESGNDILLVAQVGEKVVGYAHGAPYETLYADNLLNTICFCVKENEENAEAIANELYINFEEKAKRFGFKGIRLILDEERKETQNVFKTHGFKDHRALRHFIKYFK